MAPQNTTPKQSAGVGYIFENEVVAYFLTHLLVGRPPIEHLPGLVERIEVQRPAEIWHLDDLILTLEAQSEAYRVAFSIKSNPQFTTNGFPEDFIRKAWQQFLQHSSPEFEPEKDQLGLITSPLGAEYRKNVYDLLTRASEQAPQQLAMELDLARRANDQVRALFHSASCPPELAEEHDVGENDIGRLLDRIVWMPFDFEGKPSNRRKDGKQLCQDALRNGLPESAAELWGTLCSIANDLRTAAGSIDREELVSRVRSSFVLSDFPDHRADWQRLDRFVREVLDQIPHTIGGEVELPRKEEREAIFEGFEQTSALGLVGASGTGKTVIARSEAETTLENGRALWFGSEHLRTGDKIEWESKFDLSHSLDELIQSNPTQDSLLVLDGLDKLYDDAGFATAAQLIEMTAPGDQNSPWRLLITCQPEDWKRVLEELLKFGAPVPSVEQIPIQKPNPEELTAVWETFPSLRPLRSRPHLTPVLLRPKILDWLARRSRIEQIEVDLSVVGESDLVHWFWEREITTRQDGHVRAAAAIELATLQADRLKSSIAGATLSEELESAYLSVVEDLVSDRIIVRRGDNVAFEHDLYGDWARFQILHSKLEGGELVSFLNGRMGPMWHRPLQLLGLSLLEQSDNTEQWEAAFETVGDDLQEETIIAQDLLLESVAYISKPDDPLDDLWTLLSENDGELLDRLLKRLLFSATIPDPRIQSTVRESKPSLEIYASATTRIPYYPYWGRILDLLHNHRDEISHAIRGSVVRASELWLRYTPMDFPFRKEVAEIAVTLGDQLLREKEQHNSLFWECEPDKAVYRAVLSAGHEEPDRVSQIVLEAAGRRVRRFLPPPPSDEEKEDLQTKPPHPLPSTSAPVGPPPPPWPDGPEFRVDESLQSVVFEEEALNPLVEAQPAVAREALLGLLIEKPKPRKALSSRTSRIDRFKLERPQWHPPFYTRGPFRSFLALNEEEGIEVILRLIHHATARWIESLNDNQIQDPNTDLQEMDGPKVNIHFDKDTKEYIGNAQVFSWYRQNADSSGVVTSALMSLEKHLYDRVEAEEDVEPLIDRLLHESISTAILGPLTALGRKYPHLLQGPLRHLLTTPELLLWTLTEDVSGQTALSSMGLSLLPEPHREAYQEWHRMEHRRTSLREWGCFLYLNDEELRPMFDEARERWREELKEDGRYAGWDGVRNLVAMFDRSNYTEQTSEEGRPYLQYNPPEDLQARSEDVHEETQIHTLLLGTPWKCRRVLDGEERVDGDTLNELWERVDKLQQEELEEYHEVFPSLTDVQCGVASVMICRGEEWLSDHPSIRDWAENTILSTAKTAELKNGLHDASPTGNGYRSFVAEALPFLWSRNPANSRAREAVARFAVEAHAEVVKKMVLSARVLRASFGEDYIRLLRAIQRRSRWIEKYRETKRRARAPITGELDENNQQQVQQRLEELTGELESLQQEFVTQTLEPDLLRIRDLLPPLKSRRWVSDHSGRKYPARDLDDGLLIAAYSGFPIDASERSSDSLDWVEHWLYAIRDTVTPLTPLEDEPLRDIKGAPSPWDRFVVESTAIFLLQVDSPSLGRKFWEPILNLGPSASNLVSWFLREWTNYALAQTDEPHVTETWENMISYALDHPRWAFSHDRVRFSRGEIWRALFGFQHLNPDIWSDDLHPLTQTIKPHLRTWAESHLRLSRNAQRLALFLTMPAAEPIVPDGIIWIADAIDSEGERFLEDDTDARVAELLVYAWQHTEERLRAREEALSAFNNLLGQLTARQLPIAMELAERVGGQPKP